MSATPTSAAKGAAHKIAPALQFILLVLGCLAALPFIIGLFLVGFIWKVIDDI